MTQQRPASWSMTKPKSCPLPRVGEGPGSHFSTGHCDDRLLGCQREPKGATEDGSFEGPGTTSMPGVSSMRLEGTQQETRTCASADVSSISLGRLGKAKLLPHTSA